MAEQHFADVGKLVEALVQKHQDEADDLALSEKAKYGDSSNISTYTWVHSLKAAHQKFVRDLMDIQTALDNAPTVSPDEVRGVGKWKDVSVHDNIRNIMIASMRCSVCERYHNEVYHYGNPTEMARFCPVCGAKMEVSE